MEESEGGVDGSEDGRGEDGEKEETDKNEKNNTLMLLELLTIPILFQILIPDDDLPPNDVLCKQVLVDWEKDRSSSGI